MGKGRRRTSYWYDRTVRRRKAGGVDDRLLFVETLSVSIALKKDGKLLFDRLREKWPDEVQSSLIEAALLANNQTSQTAK
jgi:hypothetical protein